MNNRLSKNFAATRPLFGRWMFVGALLASGAQLHAQSTGLFVNSNNNVGIGTTNPTRSLSVVQSDATILVQDTATAPGYHSMLILDSAGIGQNFSQVRYSNNGTGYFAAGIDPSDAFSYKISNGNNVNTNPFLTIKTNGNVGIGTTSPVVRGGAAGGLNVYRNNGDSGVQVDTGIPNGNVFYTANSGSAADMYVTNNTARNLYFGTGSYTATQMVIDSSGNVGIGTTTPDAKLHIDGSGGTLAGTAAIEFSDGNSYGSRRWSISDGAGANTGDLIGKLVFSVGSGSYTASPMRGTAVMVMSSGGNVGIGTYYPGYMLDVAGQIHCSEIITNNYDWSDYVFKPTYKLASLSEVEGAIKRDGHLPGMPSAADVAAHGLNMGEMQAKLLQKIEELTLHQIDEEKHQIDQEKRIEQLEKENAELRERAAK
jgi:hypothetical protein